MKFNVYEKDWKETWGTKHYRDHFAWCDENGLAFQTEVGGDFFGIDADFMVCADEPAEYEVACRLVDIGYMQANIFQSQDDFDEEEKKEQVTEIEKIAESIEGDVATLRITTIEGKAYDFIYPAKYREAADA